jgi:CIC family chloride channel protein
MYRFFCFGPFKRKMDNKMSARLWPEMKALKAGSATLSTAGKWAFCFVLIGLIAGLGSAVFHLLCQVGSHFLMDQLAGYRPPAPAGEGHLFSPTQTPFNRWMLLFLPALGGIVSGWLVYTFAPEAEGHGTDAAIDAYHNKGGFIRGRIPILKTIASAVTLTSGGSGGREGPIAQIGAGFGSFLATRLKLSDRQRRIMLAAGMGAGVGSIFRAPLAGALFAAEVLYRDPEFESEVIIPAGISSVVAYCVFCLCFGWGSLFDTHDYLFRNPLELGPYTVLAFVLAGAGFLYVKAFYGVQHIAHSITKIPNHIKPAIGGLLTGAVGFFFPQTLSFGYGFAQLALDNQLPTLFLLTLGFGKILTTAFSIGSGGSGGVFGPSVVIGGALGGAVGRIFHQIMPGIVTHPGAFVVVGMAGFFAGVSNTPISTIIFVSEMTNSYHLLLPGLLVCSLSYMLSRRWTIYEKQVPSKIDSNAHKGDFFVDILAAIRVREMTDQLRKVQLIPEDMTLSDFRKIFSSSDQQYFPVVNKDNKMTGIFSINDIRGVIFDKEVGELVRMKDVANSNIIYTTPSEDLNEVFKKCTIRNLHRVPVVRDDDHSVLIGMLDRREMIQFYNQRVQEIKAGHEVEGVASDRDVSLLRDITVKEAMNPSPIPIGVDMRLDQLRDLIYDRGFNSFPVVNASGRLEGILSFSDWKSAFKPGDDTLTAGDIATRRVVSVTGQDSLFSALAKITAGEFAILPVVERDQPDKLVGVISRTDIMKAFNNVILKRPEE